MPFHAETVSIKASRQSDHSADVSVCPKLPEKQHNPREKIKEGRRTIQTRMTKLIYILLCFLFGLSMVQGDGIPPVVG
jgi:hypothetical protein